MAWRRPGDKPLSEPMTDYRRICASLSLNELTHWVLKKMCETSVEHSRRISFLRCMSVTTSDLLPLTHWGRVTHICVGNLTIIGSDNGLSPGRRQAIIWTNDGILLIWPLETNFSEILIEIRIFSLKKIRLKMSSAKCCPFRLGLNVFNLQKQQSI